jgi:hypothetical protein
MVIEQVYFGEKINNICYSYHHGFKILFTYKFVCIKVKKVLGIKKNYHTNERNGIRAYLDSDKDTINCNIIIGN